jgi:hypothetical protein
MSARVGQHARYNPATFPDAAALQALINGGEKLIILGAGTYLLNAGLTIPAGVTLVGDGSEATILDYNDAAPLTTLVQLGIGARIEGMKLQKSGAGFVTNAVLAAGDGAMMVDVQSVVMALRVNNNLCRVERCRVNSSLDGIIIAGDLNTILHNMLDACVRGIHLDGSEANIVESNVIAGSAASSRGVHLDGAADFNHVRDNTIRDIQLASPGYGVDLDATGASNQVANNIFSGTFGSKAIKAGATVTVPATTQIHGNQTRGVSPPGARLSLADFGGATGMGTT